ncbi:hypothetical protein MP228_008709 [Amoeboaphelidium protococcarum]|nr:hypothetical protein MP228_008709 [Amoeboaphelidium protococcarum]
MAKKVTRKCKLNSVLNLDDGDKEILISQIQLSSVHLTFASRLIYLCLNVWNEAGKALPELSHQQYFASMLEYLCNSAFHRDNDHTRMLSETIAPQVRQRLRHESLIGPNPNLYVFQARKIIQAISWHLTETIWVYQKKVIKAQMEAFNVKGRRLTVFLQLLNSLLTEEAVNTMEHFGGEYLEIDPATQIHLPPDYDAGEDQETIAQQDAAIKDELLQLLQVEEVRHLVSLHRHHLLDIVTTSFQDKAPRKRYSKRKYESSRQLKGSIGFKRQKSGKLKQRDTHHTYMPSRAHHAFQNQEGQKVLVQYLMYLRQTLKELGLSSFKIFPTGTDVPRHISFDNRVLAQWGFGQYHLGDQSEEKEEHVQTQEEEKQCILKLKYLGLQQRMANSQDVSISSDGFACSVSVSGQGGKAYANEAKDLERKARNTDVSQVDVGAFALENCRNLAQRLDGTRLIGIDPGKKNVLVWGDEANVEGANTQKEAKREFKDTGRISSGYWQRLALTTEFEAHLQYSKPAEITLMEQEMAQSNNSQKYLGVYIRHFEDVYAFYSKSFHRNWRFRRFCATKSAFGNVINMMHGRPKPPVPKINDLHRGRAAKKRKRELRKSHGTLLPPDKPPVIALGDAGVKHVRGNPPVPVRKFAFELSRRALVVITPEYHTSKQHSICHADLHWEHEVVLKCRDKKVKKILPGRHRAQTVCIKADGPEILSHECPDRFNRRVQSRFGVCQNCQNTGSDVIVDRDVNAYRSMAQIVRHYAIHGCRPQWNCRAERRA